MLRTSICISRENLRSVIIHSIVEPIQERIGRVHVARGVAHQLMVETFGCFFKEGIARKRTTTEITRQKRIVLVIIVWFEVIVIIRFFNIVVRYLDIVRNVEFQSMLEVDSCQYWNDFN